MKPAAIHASGSAGFQVATAPNHGIDTNMPTSIASQPRQKPRHGVSRAGGGERTLAVGGVDMAENPVREVEGSLAAAGGRRWRQAPGAGGRVHAPPRKIPPRLN